MLTWFRDLDALLRGQKTTAERLALGRAELHLRRFVPLAVLLGAAYGFFMGWFAVLNRPSPQYEQVFAATVKLPALFLLTLVVTLPSLYVFTALVGCRLTLAATLRFLVAAVVVNLAVAASFGPILGFFTFSTTSYPFMILLNVVLLAIAGLVGLGFLLKALRRLAMWEPTDSSQADAPADQAGPATDDALDRVDEDAGMRSANRIFQIWVLIYSLVGAQMGWLLRPFIGSPDLPFAWFRVREGNFFVAVAKHLNTLFGGG